MHDSELRRYIFKTKNKKISYPLNYNNYFVRRKWTKKVLEVQKIISTRRKGWTIQLEISENTRIHPNIHFVLFDTKQKIKMPQELIVLMPRGWWDLLKLFAIRGDDETGGWENCSLLLRCCFRFCRQIKVSNKKSKMLLILSSEGQFVSSFLPLFSLRALIWSRWTSRPV